MRISIVVDFGASSFNVTVLEANNGEVCIKGDYCNEDLSGRKIDEILF